MVEIPVSGRGQFEGAETDVVESLVINAVGLIRILHQLMNAQCGIVRLNHCIRYLITRTVDQ